MKVKTDINNQEPNKIDSESDYKIIDEAIKELMDSLYISPLKRQLYFQ